MTPLQLAVWSPDPVATHAYPSGSLLLSLPHACIGGWAGGGAPHTPSGSASRRQPAPAGAPPACQRRLEALRGLDGDVARSGPPAHRGARAGASSAVVAPGLVPAGAEPGPTDRRG